MKRECIVYRKWNPTKEDWETIENPLKYFLVGFSHKDFGGIEAVAIVENPLTRTLTTYPIGWIKMID